MFTKLELLFLIEKKEYIEQCILRQTVDAERHQLLQSGRGIKQEHLQEVISTN